MALNCLPIQLKQFREERRALGELGPVYLSVFPIFLSQFCSFHSLFSLYVIYLHVQTEVVNSAVFYIFPTILLRRYLTGLDLQVFTCCLLPHWRATVCVCVWGGASKTQNNFILKVIFLHTLFSVGLSYFLILIFLLLPVVLRGHFSHFKVFLNLFKGEAQMNMWMPSTVLSSEDPRIHRPGTLPENIRD